MLARLFLLVLVARATCQWTLALDTWDGSSMVGFPAISDTSAPGQPLIWPAVPLFASCNSTTVVMDVPLFRTVSLPPTPGKVHLSLWHGDEPRGTAGHAMSAVIETWTVSLPAVPSLNTVTWNRFTMNVSLEDGLLYYMGLYVDLGNYMPGQMEWLASNVSMGMQWIETFDNGTVFQGAPNGTATYSTNGEPIEGLAVRIWLACANGSDALPPVPVSPSPVPVSPSPVPVSPSPMSNGPVPPSLMPVSPSTVPSLYLMIPAPMSSPQPMPVSPPPVAVAGLDLWVGFTLSVVCVTVPVAAVIYVLVTRPPMHETTTRITGPVSDDDTLIIPLDK